MANLVSKTLTLELDTGVYYKQVQYDYDDDTRVITREPIGDSAKTLNYFGKIFKQRGIDLAIDARAVNDVAEEISDINADASYVAGILRTNPLLNTQNEHEAALTTPGWTIFDGNSTTSITFSINGGTRLTQYSVAGELQNKGARIYGGIIRLLDFPSNGTNTEFFVLKNNTQFYALPNKKIYNQSPIIQC